MRSNPVETSALYILTLGKIIYHIGKDIMCIQMELEFSNNKLQQLCENEKSATRKLGPKCAKKLKSRIADIQAADDVSELTAGRPHALQGNREGQFSIELSDGKQLILIPANNPTPVKDNGRIDWPRVTKVRVIEIVDYHD